VREGQLKHIENLTKNADSSAFRWEVRDMPGRALEFEDTTFHLDWPAKDYGEDKLIILRSPGRLADSMRVHVHCAHPPAMPEWTAPESPLVQGKEYTFAVSPAEKNARVQWIFHGQDTLNGSKARYTFPENGFVTVACKVFFNEQDCYEIETRSFDVGQDKPIMPLAELTYDTPRSTAHLKSWVWLLFLLPLLSAAWFLQRWWRRRREKPVLKTDAELAAEHPIHDKAPYFIPYLQQDGKISVLADFFRMAEVLRRRETGERSRLDIPASLRATVDGGGFPTLLDKRDTNPPDYLFLVERPSAQDQQGRLFERLTTFFQKQDAPLSVFFHDGAYNGFWNDEHQGGVSLDYLHKQYAGCRLVLLGTGHGLYNSYDTRLPALFKRWVDQLLFWKKALFLSTLPVSGWFAEEALLHRHFLLFPADTEGIRAGLEALDALEEHEPGPFTAWETALARHRSDANPRFQLWDTAEQHRSFLENDADAFKWLCGLAVTVLPDYALTIAVGKKMGLDVTHDRLLRLSRIPWLNENEPEQRLRLVLLAQLDEDEEHLARLAAAEELEAATENVAGGFAELEWKTNLAIHRFALEPENPGHRQTLRDLMQLGLFSGSQMQELDELVRRRLAPSKPSDGVTDSYAVTIAEYLNKREKKPFFTRNMVWALVLVGISLGLFAWAWWQDRQLKTQEKLAASVFAQNEAVVDSAVIWHNEAIRLAEMVNRETQYAVWAGSLQDSAKLADNLFKQSAMVARRLPCLADTNRVHFEYNMAAQRFNFFQAGAAQIGEVERASQSFERIYDRTYARLHETDTVVSFDPETRTERVFTVSRISDTVSVMNALHGKGLCQYYLSKNKQNPALLDSAKTMYAALLATDSLYFDNLRASMPVNLQTLLAAEGVIAKTQPETQSADLKIFTQARKNVALDALNNPKNKPLCVALTRKLMELGLLDPRIAGDARTDFHPVIAGSDRFDVDARIALAEFSKLAGLSYSPDTLTAGQIQKIATAEPDKFLPIQLSPDNADDAQTALAKSVLRQMQAKQYWIARSPEAYNIVYVEGMNQDGTLNDNAFNEWNDCRMLIRILRGGRPEMVLNVQATTEPGSFQTRQPLNPKGVARIAFGQYKAWKVGLHKGQQNALVQRGTEKVIRDLNKDGMRSAKDPVDIGQTFGINQHGSFNDLTPEFIDKRSAGNLVGRLLNEHMFFMEIIQKDYRYHDNSEYMFMTAILAGNEMKGKRIQTVEVSGNTDVWKDISTYIDPEMVFVKSGTFRMGSEDPNIGCDSCSKDELPAHDVTLSDYYIGKTEVTNAQYAVFLNDYQSDKVKNGEFAEEDLIEEYEWGIKFPDQTGDGRYRAQTGYENHPVVYVTWYGALEYCNWLNQKTGKKYRLPTEAEWEYAARGGPAWKDSLAYSGSNNIDEVAWYVGNSDRKTHPVGGKKANQLGLRDMSGNVWEWCSDWFDDKYYEQFRSTSAVNPEGASEGHHAVLRGGSWGFIDGPDCRPADRFRLKRKVSSINVGFRLARAGSAAGR